MAFIKKEQLPAAAFFAIIGGVALGGSAVAGIHQNYESFGILLTLGVISEFAAGVLAFSNVPTNLEKKRRWTFSGKSRRP